MKGNRYYSGKFAKMVGVSQEALRYYDAKNIFHRKLEHVDSPYSIYTDHDLACLFNLRGYNTLGLPLKKSGECIKQQNYDSVIKSLEYSKGLALKAMGWNERVLKYLEHMHTCIQSIEEDSRKIVQTKTPKMYLFDVEPQIKLEKQDKEIIKELINSIPIVKPIYRVSTHYLEDNFEGATLQFGLFEEEYAYFNTFLDVERLETIGVLKVIEPMDCIYGFAFIYTLGQYDANALKHFASYVKQHNLEVIEKPIGTLLYVNYKQEKEPLPYDYYEIWIPVKEKE